MTVILPAFGADALGLDPFRALRYMLLCLREFGFSQQYHSFAAPRALASLSRFDDAYRVRRQCRLLRLLGSFASFITCLHLGQPSPKLSPPGLFGLLTIYQKL